MTFLWIVVGVVVAMGLVALVNWWRDEQEKAGKRATPVATPSPSSLVIPAIAPNSTVLHPSIDPYLSELRAYLLEPPLPSGPGEMAQRVYTHLNEWLTTHLTADAPYDTSSDLEDQLLVEPTQRFVNMSRNDPVPPPGYLTHIMDGVNRDNRQ
jgi:hypothetical protein